LLIESSVRFIDEPIIKLAFTDACLVPGHQQDGMALGIEGKSHAPNTLGRPEAKLLHVEVSRTVQRIDLRTAKGCPRNCSGMSIASNSFLIAGKNSSNSLLNFG
jgi:hypothetical protein